MPKLIIRSALKLLSLFGEKSRVLADYWRTHYVAEHEPELINLDRIIKIFSLDTKRLAVDVGANYGLWTYALSRRFSEVIAIEPNPNLANIISRRLRATVIQTAVSNVSEGVKMWIPHDINGALVGWASLDPGNCPHALFKESINVKTMLLNDILKGYSPIFIKIDVEGHEYETLLGSVDIIRVSRPVILCEIKPHNLEKIQILIESINYFLVRSKDVLNLPTSSEMFFIVPFDNPHFSHIAMKAVRI
jgi:FkbM family methyltransferase